MCEYASGCTKRDDPFAVALWKRRNQGTLLVLCTASRHPLGCVFELPDQGKVMVTPAFTFVARSLLVAAEDGQELENPNDRTTHMHAAATPIRDYGEFEDEYGRCRHGTWHWKPQQIESRVFGFKHGLPYAVGQPVILADDTRPE